MKKIFSIIITTFLAMSTLAQTSVHDFTVNSIDGAPVELSQFKGKKMLIVNVASECGYTPQYEDLQALHEKYGDKVAVLGFPANNFGGQEPGSNEQIAQFCSKNFGVSFPMFEKIPVKGKQRHDLYAWLEEQSGEVPTWNFCKYLLDEQGKIIGFYPSSVKPMDEELVSKIK